MYNLREELEQQLGFDILPREYVFLKSVGRCLTRVSAIAFYSLLINKPLFSSLSSLGMFGFGQ